ncbi:lipopolysaccharide biosynthesis protein [Clostridium sp. DL1XJH146]
MLKQLSVKLYNNKLVKSGIWYTIGNFFIQGISFLTIGIFTRLLSTSDYGIITLYGTWLSIITVISSLGLESCVSRGKFDYEGEYDDFLSSTLLLATISFGVVFIIVLLFKAQFAAIFFRKSISEITLNDKILVLFLVFQSFFSFVINFCNTKFTTLYKYKKYLTVAITSALLNVILAIIFIYNLNENKYMGKIGAGVIIAVILGTILYFNTIVKGKIQISKNYWKYALAISIPLIPHSLSSIILAQFDRIMINSNSARGIYSFAYNIGLILTVIWAGLNKVWVPYFFENMKSKNYNDIKEKYKYYIFLFSMITFMIIFISPEIVKIMSPSSYSDGLSIVPVIIISNFFIFLYSFPSNMEFYEKETKYISIGTFMAGFTNIVLNMVFIPMLGYKIAAWTTLAAYILLFIYHYIIASKISKIKIFDIKYFLYSIIFVTFISLIFYIFRNDWIPRYCFVFSVFFIIIYKSKDYIKKYIAKT